MTTLSVALAVSRSEIARAHGLHEVFPSLYADATTLIARSRGLCLVHRHIRGASDLESPYIVELIATSPTCLECVARKTGIPVAQVESALRRIRAYMVVAVESRHCGGCLNVTTTYQLSRRDGHPLPEPARPMLVTQSEMIWRFLEGHRGQMFCTQCLSNAVMAVKRIDRAILRVEGRGARRQYGRCASCGKERLLCGLMS